MKIALASDHAGYELKTGLVKFFTEQNIPFTDLGCGPDEAVDYVDFAAKGAEEVLSGACDRAILVCGTGMGMAVAANKFKGIRATPCWNLYTAEMSRRHNDSNCLTLGGRTLGLDGAVRIVQIWLDTPFEGGRHDRRVNKIRELEERNFKQ